MPQDCVDVTRSFVENHVEHNGRDWAVLSARFPFPISTVEEWSSYNHPVITCALICFSKNFFYNPEPWHSDCKSPQLVFASTDGSKLDYRKSGSYGRIVFYKIGYEDTFKTRFQDLMGLMSGVITVPSRENELAKLEIEYHPDQTYRVGRPHALGQDEFEFGEHAHL